MLRNYQSTKELQYFKVRVPRDEAYFVYFTLESNEGLAFYSTSDDSLKGQYRDIEMQTPIEQGLALRSLLEMLQAEIRLDILEEKIIPDGQKP